MNINCQQAKLGDRNKTHHSTLRQCSW